MDRKLVRQIDKEREGMKNIYSLQSAFLKDYYKQIDRQKVRDSLIERDRE